MRPSAGIVCGGVENVAPPGDADNIQTVVLRGAGQRAATASLRPRGWLAPGAEVGGRYRIVRLLGTGGMAQVWLADDVERQLQVAFKELLVPAMTTAAEREESALLFRREYFAMKKLQHPGTVKVYDCGVMETGDRYLTMEVVTGEDLSVVAARAPLADREVYRILGRLAHTLGFVHSRLFAHCDVKAENVRITDTGDLKLMDFGIMHPIGTRATATVWGTPGYMAPEWREHGIIDGRSDLYSLGVLGTFLLTGVTPFDPDHDARGPLPPDQVVARARAALADRDPALVAIVLGLLAPDPRNRFADAAELIGALHAASGEPIVEEPVAARASYLQLPVVVGRARETAALAARLAAAKHRRARALLIGAPAGVGKSRLIQELELDARNVDAPFALGQCRAEGLSPRAPIAQALRALVPATPSALLDPMRPVLARLIPSLWATPRVFRDPSEEKIAVFDALARWLRGLAVHTPFVICIEDLHWADTATLETMNMIIRALDGTGGLVIATFRSDELSRIGLFQTVDEGHADHLELAPLTEVDLATLVELALQGFQRGAALAARLFEATRGNVFFATECLRALIEQGALRRQLGTWTAGPELASRPLPRSIGEAVIARLATLTEAQVAVLRRIAPAGRVLDIPLIQAVAGVAQPELFAVLDEAVERQFLIYVAGRYFFTHATVHEAIYDSTPAAERRGFHGRIAEHLVAVAADRPDAARVIGYHFARSDEPTRAIEPLVRAAARALEDKALLEAFGLFEQAASLLEAHPEVPERERKLIAAWGALIEVGYHSSTPAVIRYAHKLFTHWDATVDLAAGQAEVDRGLAALHIAPPGERAARLGALFPEVPIDQALRPLEVFHKRAEYRILESIALAITGRTAEFTAGLERTLAEHPQESPYRAAAHVAVGGLTSHTGHFRGVIHEMRAYVGVLRGFRDLVAACPRRLEWALGMGAYFLNMNLALMGRPLDDRATAHGLEIADRLGFTDLRVYHVFSQIVRAAFTGDGAAFAPPFAEVTELIRRLGNPRLPERNLAIYTPPYYLERGELALAEVVIQRGERLAIVLPGDRWLARYVAVYQACLAVAAITQDPADDAIARPTPAATSAAIDHALAVARRTAFRMETLVLIYQARFERWRRALPTARAAAESALLRATDSIGANPFDELLARRALADVTPGPAGHAELARAVAIATRTANVLQGGIARLALAERTWDLDADAADAQLDAADACFTAARADRWRARVAAARARLAGPPGRRAPATQ
jgi:eukaryotic-like serine/threonine-protein kinase